MNNMLIPDLRETKLPVWAQDLLKSARRRVVDAENSAREARLGTIPSESDFVIDRYDEVPIGLGKKVTVRAVIGTDADGDAVAYIDFRRYPHDSNVVEIMGSHALSIQPQVTNVVTISVAKR